MTQQQTSAVELAFGRILRMLSRPEQPGDVRDYENCRSIMLSILRDGEDPMADFKRGFAPDKVDYAPSFCRDRLLGAQGDA